MSLSLVLSKDLRERLAREAEASYPRECCGLIEGYRDGSRIVAAKLNATPNTATDDDRFEIDPTAHIALLKKLRCTKHSIVGCYHSHPNGRAEPSARDRDSAAEEGLIWLIQAADLRGFVWTAAGFSEVSLTAPALA